MKLLFALLIVSLCAGCATMHLVKADGKIYLSSETDPNKNNYGSDLGIHQRIIVNGKLGYQLVYKF